MAAKKAKTAKPGGLDDRISRDTALRLAASVSPAESREDTVNRAAAYLAFLTGEAPKPAAPEDINT